MLIIVHVVKGGQHNIIMNSSDTMEKQANFKSTSRSISTVLQDQCSQHGDSLQRTMSSTDLPTAGI